MIIIVPWTVGLLVALWVLSSVAEEEGWGVKPAYTPEEAKAARAEALARWAEIERSYRK